MQLNDKQPGIDLTKTAIQLNENKPTLTKDGSFEVKESIVLNTLIAMVLCPICVYEIYKNAADFVGHSANYLLFIPIAIYSLGIIFILRKLFNRKPIILVNQKGIYIRNELVTNWRNFLDAKYTQKEVAGSYQDNFILLLYYLKDDGEYYVRDTSLSNTQDRAEEEVVDAIRYFYQLSQAEWDVNA